MGTIGFLWTPVVKMGHFELTWDPEDMEEPEGMRRSLCFVCDLSNFKRISVTL